MGTFVFQPGMTWRKAGFALYSNSLSYREVLEQNPAWSVTQLPPPGTVLKGSSSTSARGASQQPSVYSLQSVNNSNDYYPFQSEKDYYKALSLYSSSSLKSVERVNGLTSDSRAAITGIQ